MLYRGKLLKPYRGYSIKKDWELGAFGKPVEGSCWYYAYDTHGLICKRKSLKEVKRYLDALGGPYELLRAEKEANMEEPVICKCCGNAEYYGKMRWLNGNMMCRDCYKRQWETENNRVYEWGDLEGPRPDGRS